jgi:flagellar basal body-associated protein FliL
MTLMLIDIPPDPAGMRLLPAVLLLVLGFILLLATALVVFLWYRKRSLRHVPMIRADASQTAPAQPSRPNQP